MARIEILAPDATDDQKTLAVAGALVAAASHGFDPWTAAHAIFHLEALDDLNIDDQPPAPIMMKAVDAWFAMRTAVEHVCGAGTVFDVHPDAGDLDRVMPWPPLVDQRPNDAEYFRQVQDEVNAEPHLWPPEALQRFEESRIKLNAERAVRGEPLIPPLSPPA